MTELVGNRAIEAAAIAWVIELEQAAGRQPIDRRYERAFPGDLESGRRIIEVKAVGGNQRNTGFLWLEVVQVKEARSNPDFYLYVVENVRQGDPRFFRLKVFGGQLLAQMAARAREKRYYEVPLPTRIYDVAPGLDALAE